MQEPTQPLSGEGRRRWSRNERISSIGPAGVVATACRHRGPEATREAPAVIVSRDQLATRESQAGPDGVTERLAVPMKPGNAGGGKGPQLKGNARSNEDRGIDDESSNPRKCSEVADGVARESEAFVSMPCTTRCTGRTLWPSPINAAKPTVERQEWMVRGSRTSRRTE